MGKKKTKKALEPQSPPPAAAPPEPPTAAMTMGDETQSLLGPASYGSLSYQQQDGIGQQQQQPQLRDQLRGTSSQSYAGPAVLNNYNPNAVYSSFGDINLRPNTGEDNWFDGEILGLALTEILKLLQWSNILSCSAVIVLEVLVAIFRIFAPSRFIMGCYLAFFASLLLRVEIAQIIKQHKDHLGLKEDDGTEQRQQQADNNNNTKPQDLQWLRTTSGIGSHSKIPDVGAPMLRDNFGLLFHPTGKVGILMLMGSMCVGQHNNLVELLLGLVFILNGLLIVYILCRYPGYRRAEDIPIPTLPTPKSSHAGGGGGPPVTPSAAAWSYYENDASSVWKVTTTIAEGSSLLTSSSTTTTKPSLSV